MAYLRLAIVTLLCTSYAFAQDELKMSLQEALVTAIERNLDLELQRVNLEDSALDLRDTRSQYEPQLTSRLFTTEADSEVTDRTQGTAGASFTQEVSTFNTSLDKAEDTGTSWGVDFNNRVLETSSALSLGGATYDSSITLRMSQQLLRGFSFDREIRQYDEYIARGNLQLTEYDLENSIMDVIQQTEDAYWDLVGAIDQLKVAQQSLRLAQQLYDQNKIKIEVGTLASIELINTEANIAQRESEIVTAENNVRAAEDRLKKVLNLPVDQWMQTIAPTDPLVIEELATNFEEDLQTAFDNRAEMKRNRQELENALLTRKFRENELLPELRFDASYGSSGASAPQQLFQPLDLNGDGQISPGEGLPVLDGAGEQAVIDSAYRPALSKALSNDFPNWSLALNLTWRPFNKAAKVQTSKASAAIRRVELNLEKTKLDVLDSVRAAYRELESSWRSIQASEKSLKFQQENLRAQVQKFQNGLATNYEVTEAQNQVTSSESDLSSAKINYIKAQVSYYKSLGLLIKNRNIAVE